MAEPVTGWVFYPRTAAGTFPRNPQAGTPIARRPGEKGTRMTPIFAFGGGSLIFLGVIIAILLAAVYGFYTYRGSAINAHPSDDSDDAPGAEGPSDPAGSGRTSEDNPDEFSAGGGFSTHGTR